MLKAEVGSLINDDKESHEKTNWHSAQFAHMQMHMHAKETTTMLTRVAMNHIQTFVFIVQWHHSGLQQRLLENLAESCCAANLFLLLSERVLVCSHIGQIADCTWKLQIKQFVRTSQIADANCVQFWHFLQFEICDPQFAICNLRQTNSKEQDFQTMLQKMLVLGQGDFPKWWENWLILSNVCRSSTDCTANISHNFWEASCNVSFLTRISARAVIVSHCPMESSHLPAFTEEFRSRMHYLPLLLVRFSSLRQRSLMQREQAGHFKLQEISKLLSTN